MYRAEQGFVRKHNRHLSHPPRQKYAIILSSCPTLYSDHWGNHYSWLRDNCVEYLRILLAGLCLKIRFLEEYTFINIEFSPPGTRVDHDDYEGRSLGVEVPDRITSTEVPPIPDSQVSASTKPHNQSSALRDMTNSLQINLPLSCIAAALCHVIREKGFRLSIAPTRLWTIEEQREVEEQDEAGEKKNRKPALGATNLKRAMQNGIPFVLHSIMTQSSTWWRSSIAPIHQSLAMVHQILHGLSDGQFSKYTNSVRNMNYLNYGLPLGELVSTWALGILCTQCSCPYASVENNDDSTNANKLILSHIQMRDSQIQTSLWPTFYIASTCHSVTCSFCLDTCQQAGANLLPKAWHAAVWNRPVSRVIELAKGLQEDVA